MRLINFKSYRTPTNPLYFSSKVVKLEDYISILNYLFAHNHFISNLPSSFNNFFSLVKSTHRYNTRSASNNKLKVPATKTVKYGSLSIKVLSIKTWNNLYSLIVNDKVSKNQIVTILKNIF